MKRSRIQHRNLIIIFVLVISLLVLMLVTLQQNKPTDKLPVSLFVTPSPASTTLPMDASPAPFNDSSESELFELVQQKKYQYFRVSENNQFWDYKPGQTIWYSQGDARFTLSIDIPKPNRITNRQIDLLRNNIAITTTAGEPVSFAVMDGNSEQQLVISLKGTPNSDLTLSFFSPDQTQFEPFTIYYMKEFDYKVTSEQLPLIDQAFAMSKESKEFPLSVPINQAHTFTFQFSDEVDRTSVDEHFKQKLSEAKWSVEWVDNRTFKLLVTFEQMPTNPLIQLSASGIRNARGVELKSRNFVLLEPTNIQGYGLYDLATGTQTTLLTTTVKFDSILPSFNDKWLLASTAAQVSQRSELRYELMDRKGTILKSFDYNEVYLPEWLPSSDRLVYITGKSGNRELVEYDPANDTSELIWQAPDSSSQILSFDIEPKHGNIAISWGKYNSSVVMDVKVDTITNNKTASSRRYATLGKVTCYEAACLFPIKWLNDDFLSYNKNDETYLLNLKSGQSRSFVKMSSQDSHSVLQTLQYRSKNLIVSMQEENEKEHWLWSDGEQDISFTTVMNISDRAKILRGPYGVGSTAFFYAEGKGWYRLDPAAKTARLTNDVPDSLNPALIIGQHKEKLLIVLEN